MIEPTVEDYYPRSPIEQVAATVFVGIPMTVAFVTLMSAYCIFDFVKFVLFERPRLRLVHPSEDVVSSPSESSMSDGAVFSPAAEVFSTSLAKLAQVHPQSQVVIAPNSKAVQPNEKTSDLLAKEHVR